MSKSKNQQPSARKGRSQIALKGQINRKMKRIHKSQGVTAVLNWCDSQVKGGQVHLGRSKPVSVPYSKSEALKHLGYSPKQATLKISVHEALA